MCLNLSPAGSWLLWPFAVTRFHPPLPAGEPVVMALTFGLNATMMGRFRPSSSFLEGACLMTTFHPF